MSREKETGLGLGPFREIDASKCPADVVRRFMTAPFYETPEEVQADLKAEEWLRGVKNRVVNKVVAEVKTLRGQLTRIGQKAGTLVLHPKF